MVTTNLITSHERRHVLKLSGLYTIRLLGLFMILPIFSISAQQLNGATSSLIGLALGSYGLTQAIFQLPLGRLSDRLGRKPILIMGLILFILGSIVAATANSIWAMIIARALQGAGAIGSTISAYVADVTEDKHRIQAMALLGSIIGLSFLVAMILGPYLNSHFGLHGLFWTCAGLGCLGFLIIGMLPTPIILHPEKTIPIKPLLQDSYLFRLDIGIACSHALLTASFLIIPRLLINAGLPIDKQWIMYAILLPVAFAAMVPGIIIAEKQKRSEIVLKSAILILIAGLTCIVLLHQHLWGLFAGLFAFFAAFSLCEALLPAMVSKRAPGSAKGTAMGIFSTSQFLGIFAGGSIGGRILHSYGEKPLVWGLVALSVLWFIASYPLKK